MFRAISTPSARTRVWPPTNSVEVGSGRVEDLIWHYPEPIPAAGKIKGLLCFFNEKVDLEVDGEMQERPQTPWS